MIMMLIPMMLTPIMSLTVSAKNSPAVVTLSRYLHAGKFLLHCL